MVYATISGEPSPELIDAIVREYASQQIQCVVAIGGGSALDIIGLSGALVHRGLLDGERVGAFGVSAGGIVAASMLGADPRLKAGVLVFAGAPMADVFVGTSEERVRESIDQAQRELGWTRPQIRQVLFENLRTDPIVLAPRVDSSKVLMFIATKDDSVPTATQRGLWEALGRPGMALAHEQWTFNT